MLEQPQPGASGTTAALERVPTLAEKLGTTPHLSPLLMKAKRLGLGPHELAVLAVQRGCIHYSTGTEPAGELASREQLSDAELAIALLCVSMPYDPHFIRCGAAMLGSENNSPEQIARLAVMERCVSVVRYVAEAGVKFEPDNHFWSDVLRLLPPSSPARPGVLPHPTRFVAMTGFTRKGPGLVVEWQRPRPARKYAV